VDLGRRLRLQLTLLAVGTGEAASGVVVDREDNNESQDPNAGPTP
jgi:hypothetical protein